MKTPETTENCWEVIEASGSNVTPDYAIFVALTPQGRLIV
jgi:hypothetical protein